MSNQPTPPNTTPPDEAPPDSLALGYDYENEPARRRVMTGPLQELAKPQQARSPLALLIGAILILSSIALMVWLLSANMNEDSSAPALPGGGLARCEVIANGSINVYSQPDRAADTLWVLSNGDSRRAVERLASGWLRLSSGWVGVEDVTFSAASECERLPEADANAPRDFDDTPALPARVQNQLAEANWGRLLDQAFAESVADWETSSAGGLGWFEGNLVLFAAAGSPPNYVQPADFPTAGQTAYYAFGLRWVASDDTTRLFLDIGDLDIGDLDISDRRNPDATPQRISLGRDGRLSITDPATDSPANADQTSLSLNETFVRALANQESVSIGVLLEAEQVTVFVANEAQLSSPLPDTRLNSRVFRLGVEGRDSTLYIDRFMILGPEDE